MIRDSKGPDVHHDHDAEIQGRNGIHSLIAGQKALDRRDLVIGRQGGAVGSHRMDQTAHEHCPHQQQKHGAQELAQPSGQLLRLKGHQEGGGKKKQGVAELKPHRGGARGQEGRDRHLKRGAGRPGDGQAGADGQIDQNGEHSGKGGMDPAGQFCQTPCPHHSDHTQNWEKHRADRQPGHSEPGVHPGLRAQLGWKDQVARTKEH